MLSLIYIAGIADESDRAFMENLFLENRYLMFYIAKQCLNNNADAEDAVSESCISFIKKINLLRHMDKRALKAYITTTVKNNSLLIAAKKKKYVCMENIAAVESGGEAPDEQLIRNCTIEQLKAALEKLDETDRLVLRMRYFLKYSDEEIGKATALKPSSVRARLSRARIKLYCILKGEM